MNDVKKESAHRFRQLMRNQSYWKNVRGEKSAAGKMLCGLIELYGSKENVPDKALETVHSLNKRWGMRKEQENE